MDLNLIRNNMTCIDEFEFEILGEPLAWQSVKVARKNSSGMIFYTPKKIKNKKNYISNVIINAIEDTENIFPTDKLISVEAVFCYRIPDSISKKKHNEIMEKIDRGTPIFRGKRPDLQDNLMKGLVDSLTGILWHDDKQVVYINSAKIYSDTDKTLLKIKILGDEYV